MAYATKYFLFQLLVNFCHLFRELESKQIPSILTGRMSSLNFIFTVKMCASRRKLGKIAKSWRMLTKNEKNTFLITKDIRIL